MVRRPKQIAEKQITIGNTRVTVQVIAPKEIPEVRERISSRDDSRSPGQQFMRANRPRFFTRPRGAGLIG